jgi:uncharacterized membrane protein
MQTSFMLSSARRKLIFVLGASSIVSVFLSLVRIYISETWWYLFLLWNLFLAWIPFICTTAYQMLSLKNLFSKIFAVVLIVTWLIFFPNAPYIITDLMHVRIRGTVPLWYDVVLILAYVWNGMILGYISLFDMHQIFKKKFTGWTCWCLVVMILWLTSFGIYLGRFIRWNSWDIFYHPLLLIKDIAAIFSNPLYQDVYGMTTIFTLFLFSSYGLFRFLIKNGETI